MEVAFPAPRQANKHAVNCRLTSHVLAACRPPTTDHTPPTAKCRLLPPPPIFYSYRRTQPHLHTCGQCPRTNTHTHTCVSCGRAVESFWERTFIKQCDSADEGPKTRNTQDSGSSAPATIQLQVVLPPISSGHTLRESTTFY